MTTLILIQVLHILTGSIWLSSFIFLYFILWPTFVKVNSPEALVIKNALKKPIGLILGIVGVIAISLGIIRGIFFSGINNWNSLLSPYGRSFIGAILVTLFMILIGRFYGHNLVTIPWKEKWEMNRILVKIYLTGAFILVCYFLLLFFMVSMRFGGI